MRLTKKETRIMAFLLLLLVITVGYALLSQTLDINGTSKIKKTTWSIIWDNVEVNSNSVSGTSVTQAAQITNTEKTLVEYSITLSEPGEFYEFTVDAKNEGTIDGMVNVVSNKTYESNGTTEKALPEYLKYSVTYSDGKAIVPKQLLKAGTTEKYKVRVEFKDVEASQLPAQEETIKFKFSVDYVQADDSAQAVTHALTGTRYTTNKYDSTYGYDSYVLIGKKPTDNITLYETAAEAKAAQTAFLSRGRTARTQSLSSNNCASQGSSDQNPYKSRQARPRIRLIFPSAAPPKTVSYYRECPRLPTRSVFLSV